MSSRHGSKLTKKVVILERGHYTSCTVHLYGGTILSYRVKNVEMLYMKKKTSFDQFTAIRGGIKFTFPYFGKRITGPKHGFARYVPWYLESGPTTNSDGDIEAVFSLSDTEYTKSIWNYKFKISYKLTLCKNELRIDMSVENTCKYFPCYFTALRHSIFKVDDSTKCEVHGLCNRKYFNVQDKTLPPKLIISPDSKITINRKFWDLYVNAPDIVELRKINDHGHKLRMFSTNSSNINNVLIYNPWKEDHNEVEAIESHEGDEYLYCVGVGQGHISSVIRLEPKQIWESYHVIQVINEEENRKIEKLARLLDDPLNLFNETCLRSNIFIDSYK